MFKKVFLFFVLAMSLFLGKTVWAQEEDLAEEAEAKFRAALSVEFTNNQREGRTTRAGVRGDPFFNIVNTKLKDGDIIVMRSADCSLPIKCFWQHAAVYDSVFNNVADDNSSPFWTAYKGKVGSPDGVDGVDRQSKSSVKTYYLSSGIRISNVDAKQIAKTLNYIRSQGKKPYNITSTKNDDKEWYCSKLAWRGYKEGAGIDLDQNGGYYVTPDDLFNNTNSRIVFAYGNMPRK